MVKIVVAVGGVSVTLDSLSVKMMLKSFLGLKSVIELSGTAADWRHRRWSSLNHTASNDAYARRDTPAHFFRNILRRA